ncbi:MAG: phosphate ABC transporter, permease protein PstA [Alkaliphilus sp.]|nr:phosphate ABC transporter permease PstA [bacterium AH-315-E09]PHS36088.1 MAG: phosphate ABC transporter, permease protein PstA [Alkaliphilus sp.]
MSKNFKEKFAFTILALITMCVIIPALFIFSYIIYNGIGTISLEFIFSAPRRGMTEGGIFPAIVGTMSLILGTIVFALPLGVGTAIYLVEYAKKNLLTKLISLAILNLAGVPSVVYGLFGLGLFVLLLGFGSSILSGALTLSCLILPIIIKSSEAAIKSVPNIYREASLALGATKWQTIYKVVLPTAMPGIITGAILGIGRAAGETAAILLTVAAFFLPRLPNSIMDQVMVLSYHLYIISSQVPGMPDAIKNGTALVLLGVVGIFFFVATVVRIRYKLANRE